MKPTTYPAILKLADITFTANTYAGEAASGYVAKSLLMGQTLDQNLITIIPNIKKSLAIRPISHDVVLQDPACDFTPAGNDVDIDERLLSPVEFAVMEELCFKDLKTSWEAGLLPPGADESYQPTNELADWLIMNYNAKTSIAVDKLIWNGKAGTTEATFTAGFTGLIPMFKADATVIDVASPAAGGITSVNVIAELTKVYNTQPQQLRKASDWTWYVANDVASNYRIATAEVATGSGAYYVGDRQLDFLGHDLVEMNHFPAGHMVLARKSNLFFGTDLVSDFNEIDVVDMRRYTADKKVRYSATMTADVNYAFGDEIVLYTPGA